MLRLHDTANGYVVPFVPREEGKITMYVCGPTVYDLPHVGHGRFVLVYDVLRRFLTFQGNEVIHVSNVTDIDDKIIDRANREGRDWKDVAVEYEERWWSTLDTMGVLKPTQTPHATAFIDQMVQFIAELIALCHAYETSDGVYLSVADVPDYGLLKHQDLDELLSGARVDVIEEKRAPGDFALWKRVKPGEPSWPSPFGEGRPGWHTECVVMSLALLGEGFDLHGGGQDLIFPHHENERAQAVVVGKRFSQHWLHNGLVTRNGEKMSKSLGNYTTLDDLLAATDPRAYRLLVLRSHYRSPLEVTPETLDDAAAGLSRIDTFNQRLSDSHAVIGADRSQSTEPAELTTGFIAAMENDLDTPAAIGLLFQALRRANSLIDDRNALGVTLGDKVMELFGALGITSQTASFEGEHEALALLAERDTAREQKDYAKSDALRSQIEALGFKVEDTPNGGRLSR